MLCQPGRRYWIKMLSSSLLDCSRDLLCEQLLTVVLAGEVNQHPPAPNDREEGSPHEQLLTGIGVVM